MNCIVCDVCCKLCPKKKKKKKFTYKCIWWLKMILILISLFGVFFFFGVGLLVHIDTYNNKSINKKGINNLYERTIQFLNLIGQEVGCLVMYIFVCLFDCLFICFFSFLYKLGYWYIQFDPKYCAGFALTHNLRCQEKKFSSVYFYFSVHMAKKAEVFNQIQLTPIIYLSQQRHYLFLT